MNMVQRRIGGLAGAVVLGALAASGIGLAFTLPGVARRHPLQREPRGAIAKRTSPSRTSAGRGLPARVRENDPGGAPARGASPDIQHWETVEGFPTRLAVFRSVFWEPQDTVSLRRRIRRTPIVKGKRVLEIGTGCGLLSLCCLQAGARKVVATDVNPAAISNATYNAERLGLGDRLDARLVPLNDAGAYSVIGGAERFDLIISNPPWVNHRPKTIDEYAFYDPAFALQQSLLEGLPRHLAPGGKALLAYGCVTAIRRLERLARQYRLDVQILDDRQLDQLPDVFLPGMLLEVTAGRRAS